MEKIQRQHVTTVGEFMTTSVVSVTSEMNIYQAIMFLVEHRISGAPVTNPDDRHELVGIISEKDCLLLLANGAYYGMPSGKVSDYMSRNVLTVDSARDVFAVADIFLKNRGRLWWELNHATKLRIRLRSCRANRSELTNPPCCRTAPCKGSQLRTFHYNFNTKLSHDMCIAEIS